MKTRERHYWARAGGPTGSEGQTRPAAPGDRGATTVALVAVAALTGLTVTLLTSATSLIEFAYPSVPLHVAVETVAAMASLLAAQLVHGRFRRSLGLDDLLLFCALCCFAASNLLFSAVPAAFGAEPGRFATWAPVTGSLLSTALLAAAAFAPARSVGRLDPAVRTGLLATGAVLGLIAGAVLAAGDALPVAVPPHVGPADGAAVGVPTDPLIVLTQVVAVLLFVAAAAGFGLRAARTTDLLARWLAIGATLGAFARLNYALFPSLYTEWFYTGDVLRLGCFLAVFAGAVRETRRLQDALAVSTLLEERRRIARNLHDGVAQDLAFILQQLRHAAERDAQTPGLERLIRAAERALDESRHAVAVLSPSGEARLGELLAGAAHEAGEREGSSVETALPADIAVPPETQEALMRLVREAVVNAARHGHARHIRVQMGDSPELYVEITDDGRGFDLDAAPPRRGRRGIAGMHERVASIGGELTITSEPGRGTRVRVTLP